MVIEGLAEAGPSVICIETRHTKAFLTAQPNKTDRNDARGVCGRTVRLRARSPSSNSSSGRCTAAESWICSKHVLWERPDVIEIASDPRLDADHPICGVLIPCLITLGRYAFTLPEFVTRGVLRPLRDPKATDPADEP